MTSTTLLRFSLWYPLAMMTILTEISMFTSLSSIFNLLSVINELDFYFIGTSTRWYLPTKHMQIVPDFYMSVTEQLPSVTWIAFEKYTCSTSDGSDHTAHLRSMIWTFDGRTCTCHLPFDIHCLPLVCCNSWKARENHHKYVIIFSRQMISLILWDTNCCDAR